MSLFLPGAQGIDTFASVMEAVGIVIIAVVIFGFIMAPVLTGRRMRRAQQEWDRAGRAHGTILERRPDVYQESPDRRAAGEANWNFFTPMMYEYLIRYQNSEGEVVEGLYHTPARKQFAYQPGQEVMIRLEHDESGIEHVASFLSVSKARSSHHALMLLYVILAVLVIVILVDAKLFLK